MGYVLRGNDGSNLSCGVATVVTADTIQIKWDYRRNESAATIRPCILYSSLRTHIGMISVEGRRKETKEKKSYATSNDADVQSLESYIAAAACSILTIFFFFFLWLFPLVAFTTEYKFPSSANVWLRHDRLDMHSEWRDKSRTEKK
jgi:hypothetical protein